MAAQRPPLHIREKKTWTAWTSASCTDAPRNGRTITEHVSVAFDIHNNVVHRKSDYPWGTLTPTRESKKPRQLRRWANPASSQRQPLLAVYRKQSSNSQTFISSTKGARPKVSLITANVCDVMWWKTRLLSNACRATQTRKSRKACDVNTTFFDFHFMCSLEKVSHMSSPVSAEAPRQFWYHHSYPQHRQHFNKQFKTGGPVAG